VGIRLGALVAAEVAAHRSDVAGMVAIAPVVSGRKWIRESRALHQSLDLSVPPPGVPFTPPEGLLEVAGYVLTAETRAALERTNLEEAERAPAPAVLVLDRDDMAPSTAWIERLQALGCSVDARRLPGYVEMVVDPHKSRIPAALLEATIEFAQSRPVLPAKTVVPMARTTPTALFGDVVEEPMVTRAGVRGIVSRPAQGRAARRALVLLNAGGVRRIGPNRLYTTLARRFAREDMLVLRIDLSGIGDTPARPDMPENLSYHEHALDDIASVLEWVRAQGVEDAHLCGMCSGGYYAFQAALADRAWAGLVAVNPGDPAGQDSPYEAANYAAHTMRRIPQLDAWLKLIRGNVNVSKAMRMLSRRARSLLQSRVIDLARSLGLRVEGDVGADLLTIASRDVKTTFVFCDREPGLPLFRERGGSAVRRLTRGGKVSVRIVVGPDHTYTPYWSHDVLIDEIRVAVTRRSR
jgi:pimeloyl-ACP methyl ester carboxylesterase